MNNIRLLIAYAMPDQQHEVAVEVPTGTTLQQGLALHAKQIGAWLNGQQAVATGVWGKVRAPHYVLREGDRIEIYRSLKADPKQARRTRVQQRSKSV